MIFMVVPMYLTGYYLEEKQVFENTMDYFLITLFSIYGIIVFVVGFSMFFVPEKKYGQSFGKYILKIYTVDKTGIKISWKQAIIRNLFKYLFDFLPIDFLIGFMLRKEGENYEKATDLLAETRVIKWQV